MIDMLPDLQQMLRIKAIVDSLSMPDGSNIPQDNNPNPTQMSPPVNPGVMPAHSMADLFTPKDDVGKQYQDTLSNMPTREDPSTMRKIGAYFSGVGAGLGPAGLDNGQPVGLRFDAKASSNATDNFINGPYNQKMGDWANKAKVLGAGAQEEDKDNQIGNLAARNTMLGEQAVNKQDETERANKEREASARMLRDRQQQDADTRAKRAEIAAEMVKGGILSTDEQTGKTFMVYKDGTKKDVDISKLTPEDKLELKQHNDLALQARKSADALANALAEIKARHDNPPKTGSVNGQLVTDPKTGQTFRVRPDNSTEEIVLPTGANRNTPDNENKATIMKMQQFVKNPTVVKQFETEKQDIYKFFKTDPASGSIIGLKDRKEFTDPDDLNHYTAIYKYFYPDKVKK